MDDWRGGCGAVLLTISFQPNAKLCHFAELTSGPGSHPCGATFHSSFMTGRRNHKEQERPSSWFARMLARPF